MAEMVEQPNWQKIIQNTGVVLGLALMGSAIISVSGDTINADAELKRVCPRTITADDLALASQVIKNFEGRVVPLATEADLDQALEMVQSSKLTEALERRRLAKLEAARCQRLRDDIIEARSGHLVGSNRFTAQLAAMVLGGGIMLGSVAGIVGIRFGRSSRKNSL